MITVGLTGGIGAGKSLIAGMFRALGVPIFESDLEGRKILESEDIIFQISNTFGGHIIVNGRIDRVKLAKAVFSDNAKLEVLNSIIHPAVRRSFDTWKQVNKSAIYGINETAILFESGLYKQVDFSINVYAPIDIRVGRVLLRDLVSKEAVMERISNQMPDEHRANLATWNIVNDGRKAILPQVLEIDRELRNVKL